MTFTKMRRTTILLAATALLAAGAAVAGVAPGDAAPDFKLEDIDGGEHALKDYLADGKTVVLEWFNPDCPFIRKHHATFKTMNETFAAAKDGDVVWLAINSGAPGKQGAGLERNKKAAEEFEMPFPLLLDEDGAVGKAYGAKTTPHMFIVTPDGKVVYNGAIDDDRSPGKLGETNYVAAALAELAGGEAVTVAESKPYGCSVKYGD